MSKRRKGVTEQRDRLRAKVSGETGIYRIPTEAERELVFDSLSGYMALTDDRVRATLTDPDSSPEAKANARECAERFAQLREFWAVPMPLPLLLYRDLVRAALSGGGRRVLHAGCGRDKREITSPYRDCCDIVGIDLDAEAGARFHSTFVLGSVEDMDAFFPNEDFDVICCENVIEHLARPGAAFLEFGRVLKPGGHLLVQTPNFWSYKAQAAWVLPQSVHLALGRRRYGVAEPEMYPTLYRCNTARALVLAAAAAGLAPSTLVYQNNGATWLRATPVLGHVLKVWHRAMDWPALAWARCTIVGKFTKALRPAPSLPARGNRR